MFQIMTRKWCTSTMSIKFPYFLKSFFLYAHEHQRSIKKRKFGAHDQHPLSHIVTEPWRTVMNRFTYSYFRFVTTIRAQLYIYNVFGVRCWGSKLMEKPSYGWRSCDLWKSECSNSTCYTDHAQRFVVRVES